MHSGRLESSKEGGGGQRERGGFTCGSEYRFSFTHLSFFFELNFLRRKLNDFNLNNYFVVREKTPLKKVKLDAWNKGKKHRPISRSCKVTAITKVDI